MSSRGSVTRGIMGNLSRIPQSFNVLQTDTQAVASAYLWWQSKDSPLNRWEVATIYKTTLWHFLFLFEIPQIVKKERPNVLWMSEVSLSERMLNQASFFLIRNLSDVKCFLHKGISVGTHPHTLLQESDQGLRQTLWHGCQRQVHCK